MNDGPIVFDNEPLLAVLFDEPGRDIVEPFLRAVYRGDREGYISYVTYTELLYTVARAKSWKFGETAVEELERQNVVPVAVRDTWWAAARFKHDYPIALGDAFALAAADHIDGTLLVGADDDFDTVDEVAIERFRAEGV
ncbi:PIN domain-containing protein [Halococcus dombrowskii]|uniref:PIN domain-containing protein n=1 Tax=Halococcus dombrowskii TaxID=179637 RepID=A0AAV3SC38_HALDO|nr:PIN domain-containing protein [Halococcus dombrowskii]UOO94282.1 PIN domain-containing protein [Halococcus dombrowskii]